MDNLEIGETDEDAIAKMENTLKSDGEPAHLIESIAKIRDEQTEPEERQEWDRLLDKLQRYGKQHETDITVKQADDRETEILYDVLLAVLYISAHPLN